MGKIKISGYECERCKHKWIPRGNKKPIVCAYCKSAYWNIPRKNRKKLGRRKMERKEAKKRGK